MRQLKSYTSTTRFQSYVSYKETLTTKKPYKDLTTSKKKKVGRNNSGRITVRHKGGGHKNKYRIIDWKRSRKDVIGEIVSIEYDPNRTAFISLVQYVDGDRKYMLATDGVKLGTQVISSENADIRPGNSLPLSKVPSGTTIHSIELKPGSGASLVRSAGAFATVVGRVENYTQIRMPSGELRLISDKCFATIGSVSNSEQMNISLGKAGRSRWKGIRPTVRGVAMNPIDHPMGGGEGRTSGGRHPCSPWGQLAKGYKTRKSKTTDKFIISRRKTHRK